MSAPRFDTYLAIDWSASTVPKTGADSLWIAIASRDGAGRLRVRLHNPATRHAARNLLCQALRAVARHNRRTLVTIDVNLGFPEGFAAMLGVADWASLWDHITPLLEDHPDNSNNRFAVAAALNAQASGRAFPFWGCPARQAGPYLQPKRPTGYGPHIPQWRLTEQRVRAGHPVWKLYTTGSVGGQTLTAVPVLRRLRHDPVLAAASVLWPFETGLTAPPDRPVVWAETYFSLIPPEPRPGEPKDAGQVRAFVRALDRWDRDGALRTLFEGAPSLNAAERDIVVREEGWVLGVTGPVLKPAW